MIDFTNAVIGGVLVFIASQYIQKFIFEPILDYKKTTTEISHLLLLNQAKLHNDGEDENELKNNLHALSSKLRAFTKTIPFYCFLRCIRIFGLPEKENILKASHCLNILGYGVVNNGESRKKKITKNIESINELRNLLNIETSYSNAVDKP
ncbi:hypothetical protein SAMN05660420_00821 [Desulfuromusa kysingii]|uniref:Uncharacterized protein n=1 Tax=Desulfuromusa kysingii TaxID=37625 RepID=A0A1H3X4H7_9BACT|nr:hypothetical protein [Desulfuromusa kysingii]SDZ94309.1 hypothetical protein SAMN05660420_00821 [Desulfuromusa kysingii]